jgi:TolA-binding protein
MFAQLQVKDMAPEAFVAPPAAAPPAMEAAPASGSAFGFINSGSTPAAAPAAAAVLPVAVPPPAPTTFDPLKTLTPTTAAKQIKSMHISPEQMQAMAYQQQMYQLQMQQMQMALMMQQQQGGGTGMVMPPGMPLYRQGSGGPSVGGMPPAGAGAPRLVIGQQPRAAQRDDKKFDFVQDAMFSEKKK